MIFLLDKHNIKCSVLKYKIHVYSVNLTFLPGFKSGPLILPVPANLDYDITFYYSIISTIIVNKNKLNSEHTY